MPAVTPRRRRFSDTYVTFRQLGACVLSLGQSVPLDGGLNSPQGSIVSCLLNVVETRLIRIGFGPIFVKPTSREK